MYHYATMKFAVSLPQNTAQGSSSAGPWAKNITLRVPMLIFLSHMQHSPVWMIAV
jgi:hypothetical protein